MKYKIVTWTISSLATALLVFFAVGLLWSIIPMAGNTLPHHLKTLLGISYPWSALLISFLLGLAFVSIFVLTALIQTLEFEQQLDR